ncbi:hypothetical protein EX895_000325 [Sporisorium graminicola]|uniref:Uncharacterized protein n=1 Tax=Sporisorium graminicola TaxID=280036 RepID=A0A4U7L0X0_9BASI|nr:hypothetical protein EX895_000325 [Sporisorium graminicola]TKY90327.1 hypothetical protein EX895_000325 [Sporisorium graminicola]
MAEQSKWSSSRVAHLRTGAQQPQPTGTQQSRWATNTSTNVSSSTSSVGSTAASSSWRSRPDKASASSSGSAWRPPRQSQPPFSSDAAVGSSGSRWASPRFPAAQSNSVANLTDTLAGTSIASSPPSISIHSSPRTLNHSPAKGSVMRADGLQARDASRPLGGKSLDRLALLASPSRGLDSTSSLSTDLSSQGSMDLTLPQVQAELREYISMRITKAIPLLSAPAPALRVLDSRQYLPREEADGAKGVGKGEEELQQILLLVRKLREALVASKRVDGFSVEVYELSASLAVLCVDVPQLAATLPRLVLELYPSTREAAADPGRDVEQLATHLGIHPSTGEDKRMRLVSLYLLQTLCLSGRATRLGQYAAAHSERTEALHRGLSEYKRLKATLTSVYGERLHSHLAVSDAVYAALRNVDSLTLSRLLCDTKGGMNGWQRLIALQVVPALRSAAWEVARKAYMYMPVSERLKGMIIGGEEKVEQGPRDEEDGFWVQLLLLGTDALPPTPVGEAKQDSLRKQEQTLPDEWDADDDPSQPSAMSASGEQEDARLLTFLTSQFGLTLPDRIMSIKHGHAVKLR